MIAEFAVTPDTFKSDSYESPAEAGHCLNLLWDLCQQQVVLRDLCDGNWSRNILERGFEFHHVAAKLLKSLKSNGRLLAYPTQLDSNPEDTKEWLYEALASHGKEALDLIITPDPDENEHDGKVTSICNIRETSWWSRNNKHTEMVRRNLEDFKRVLSPIMKKATKKFWFIDPHIDERRRGYEEFWQIIEMINPRLSCRPNIQIHVWAGWENPTRSALDCELRFKKTIVKLKQSKLSAELFVWPLTFHNRYFISDFVGVHMGNSFDIATSQHQAQNDTWTRLDQTEVEKHEFLFDPNKSEYGIPFRINL